MLSLDHWSCNITGSVFVVVTVAIVIVVVAVAVAVVAEIVTNCRHYYWVSVCPQLKLTLRPQ